MSRLVMVGVDVGGTFTDLFLFDEASGTVRTGKVGSRRGREAEGFIDGHRGDGGAGGVWGRSCTAPPSAPMRSWNARARGPG